MRSYTQPLMTLLLSLILLGCEATSQPLIQTPDWFRDVVLYEIFPRSFYDSNGDGSGDLKGITLKLDDLRDLGVGALWLTPIFASASYHGYDTVDYYQLDPAFGSDADLSELVREAHKRNMRVLLDYVAAHTSNQHPFFKDAFGNLSSPYADWYRWTDTEHRRYESFQGVKELPTLNHENPDVQKHLVDVAKYWMTKTGNGNPLDGIDGYRCDYVLNVPHAFWKKLRAELKAVRPDFLLLAEAWTNMRDIKPFYKPSDGISVEEQQGKAGSLLEHYRALAALRNAHPALRRGSVAPVSVDGSDKVYAFLRANATSAFLIVLNFKDTSASVTLDLRETTLPKVSYTASDALSKKVFRLDSLMLKAAVEPLSGYVLQLTRR